MIDVIGQELKINDKILYAPAGNAGFIKGKVIMITDKKITFMKLNSSNTKSVWPNHCVKVKEW